MLPPVAAGGAPKREPPARAAAARSHAPRVRAFILRNIDDGNDFRRRRPTTIETTGHDGFLAPRLVAVSSCNTGYWNHLSFILLDSSRDLAPPGCRITCYVSSFNQSPRLDLFFAAFSWRLPQPPDCHTSRRRQSLLRPCNRPLQLLRNYILVLRTSTVPSSTL